MAADFQAEKQVVIDYYAALDGAKPDEVGAVAAQFIDPQYFWRGFHPFNALESALVVFV